MVGASFMVVYCLFSLWFLAGDRVIPFWNKITGKQELQGRLLDLSDRLARQQDIIDVQSRRTRQSSFLRKIDFDENWATEKSRLRIMRLLDYAEFALEKEDYRYAERLYQEASEIQQTITVPYYKGRLNYLLGDLEGAEAEWREAIRLDDKGRYPELRLYLAISLYEMDKDNETKKLLKEILHLTGRDFDRD